MGLILGTKDIEAGLDLMSTHLFNKTHYIEVQYPDGSTGAQRFHKMEPPRLMWSHLSFDFFQKQFDQCTNKKIINVMRNPKDTLVSYFHHYSHPPQLGQFTGTWNQFFDLAIQGKLHCEDIFDFMAKWYKFNKDRKNSLVIKYEDMQKDRKGHILKIAKFMGCDVSDNVVDYILQKTSVPVMYDEVNSMTGTKTEDGSYQGLKLVRKGEVGNWVNYFSKQQSDLVDEKCAEHFEPLGLTFQYSL